MTAEDSEERMTRAREVVDQFRNFGSALYTYQDYADDFDLPEEGVLEILNNHNKGLSKDEMVSKLIELKSS
jgi:hypothetical protein